MAILMLTGVAGKCTLKDAEYIKFSWGWGTHWDPLTKACLHAAYYHKNFSTFCFKEAENLLQLLVFLQQKTAEENAHIKELKTYLLQQVC